MHVFFSPLFFKIIKGRNENCFSKSYESLEKYRKVEGHFKRMADVFQGVF